MACVLACILCTASFCVGSDEHSKDGGHVRSVPPGIRFARAHAAPPSMTSRRTDGAYFNPMAARRRPNDPTRWRTGCPAENGVTRGPLYAGVTLVMYEREERMCYDLVVDPGVRPDVIRIASAPDDWDVGARQQRDGLHVPVPLEVVEHDDGTLRFNIDSYERTKPLVISWQTAGCAEGVVEMAQR